MSYLKSIEEYFHRKAGEALAHTLAEGMGYALPVTPPTVIEEILVDLLCHIPHVAISTSEDFGTYWEQVGSWLNQIPDEFERSRWMLQFVINIHQAWGVPMPRAAQCLQWAMSDAMGGRSDKESLNQGGGFYANGA